ncbi:MAG TPA: hypothetical protein VIV60_26370 [Polyangiaceae bacterium]
MRRLIACIAAVFVAGCSDLVGVGDLTSTSSGAGGQHWGGSVGQVPGSSEVVGGQLSAETARSASGGDAGGGAAGESNGPGAHGGQERQHGPYEEAGAAGTFGGSGGSQRGGGSAGDDRGIGGGDSIAVVPSFGGHNGAAGEAGKSNTGSAGQHDASGQAGMGNVTAAGGIAGANEGGIGQTAGTAGAGTAGAGTAGTGTAGAGTAGAGTAGTGIAGQGTICAAKKEFEIVEGLTSLANDASSAWHVAIGYRAATPAVSDRFFLATLPFSKVLRDDQLCPTCQGLVKWTPATEMIAPMVGLNPTENDHTVGEGLFPKRAVTAHPGEQGEYAAVFWTAPCHGNISIDFQFVGVLPATTDVHMLVRGRDVFSADIEGLGAAVWQQEAGSLVVQFGDEIGFAVGRGNNDWSSDMMLVQVTIKLSPP